MSVDLSCDSSVVHACVLTFLQRCCVARVLMALLLFVT